MQNMFGWHVVPTDRPVGRICCHAEMTVIRVKFLSWQNVFAHDNLQELVIKLNPPSSVSLQRTVVEFHIAWRRSVFSGRKYISSTP